MHPAPARCFFDTLKGVRKRDHDQRRTNPANQGLRADHHRKGRKHLRRLCLPTNLQVVITMKANELPNITVNREFFSDIMMERNGGHIKQASLNRL